MTPPTFLFIVGKNRIAQGGLRVGDLGYISEHMVLTVPGHASPSVSNAVVSYWIIFYVPKMRGRLESTTSVDCTMRERNVTSSRYEYLPRNPPR